MIANIAGSAGNIAPLPGLLFCCPYNNIVQAVCQYVFLIFFKIIFFATPYYTKIAGRKKNKYLFAFGVLYYDGDNTE